MIIQCTNCRAKFRVADSKLKKDETNVRCAKCGQIFVSKVGQNAFPDNKTIDPVAAQTASVPEEKIKGGSDELSENSSFEDALFDSKELDLDEDTKSKRIPASIMDDIAQELGPESSPEDAQRSSPPADAASLSESMLSESKLEDKPIEVETRVKTKTAIEKDLKAKKEPKKKDAKKEFDAKPVSRRMDYAYPKWVWAIYPLVVIVAMFAGLLFVGLHPSLKNLSLLKADVADSIKPGLTITRVTSDFVTTLSGVDLYVIWGEIYNNSGKLDNNITLEGEIYSSSNSFIAKEKFSCCYYSSKLALYEVPDFKTIDALYEKESIREIGPYKSLPFILVYRKPDEPIISYRINILNEQKKTK